MNPDSGMMNSSKKPILWANLQCGVRLEDYQESRLDAVLKMMKKYYFKQEVLCRSINLLDDNVSVEFYLQIIQQWLKDKMTIVAVNSSNKTVGVAICKVVSLLAHSRTYSKVKLVEGKKYSKILEFQSHVHFTENLFEKYNIENYLRIYAVCVKPSWRGKGIGMALYKSCAALCHLVGLPVLMGIFTSFRSQKLATKLGMEVISEVYYSTWVENEEYVFADPGAGNYTSNLMAMEISKSVKLCKRLTCSTFCEVEKEVVIEPMYVQARAPERHKKQDEKAEAEAESSEMSDAE